jgi:hypothetical protein
MANKIWSYFELAGKIAVENAGDKSWLLAAIGIRNDSAIVSAVNSISQVPNRLLHAERRLTIKLDYGATVYVARVRRLDGKFGMAMPCKSCFKALKYRNVFRCYYTIDSNSFGVIEFD